MTWQLGSKPGVVDAVDAHGRPLAVPLPACPPCTGNCHQSDWCDAEPESDSLAIFDALRNAVILTLAGVGAGSLVALLWLAVGR